METRAKEIRYFFYSQQLADGVRTTLAILLPAIIGNYANHFDIGLTISLGALCVSFVDAPGPLVHKKNAMLLCILSVFLVSLLTVLARQNMYSMGAEIVVFSFFFSMFNVYGNRAASLGNASLLVMILTMDKPVEPAQAGQYSLFIAAGGIFYMLISLFIHQIRPYRTAQRALGECIRELSSFLTIKADFYNTKTDLDDDYKKLIAQQIVVSEKQEAVRELLFKSRQFTAESTPMGRKLVLTFINTVDLFEDITATYYDYTALRKQLGATDILDDISSLIQQSASELDRIGAAIQSDTAYKEAINYDAALTELKKRTDAFYSKEHGSGGILLKKILVNLRRVMQRIRDIVQYFDAAPLQESTRSRVPLDRFVSHQSLQPGLLWNNLTFSSSVFLHAFRVAIACMTGFIIAKLMAASHHSYWIVMTITFMLKPAFSLTKQRNYHRVTGTLIGGTIGVLILFLVKNKDLQFLFMVIFMIGTYTFQRVKYFLSVIFTTAFILILFKFLGVGFLNVIAERVVDTIIGCAVALLAGYLLFPKWESEELSKYMLHMLQANEQYLRKILEVLTGKKVSVLDYKLARKEVYVSSANLAAAFQRMLSEPKSKQKHAREIHQFVVLNHILFSNIATVAATVMHQAEKHYPEGIIRSAKKAISVLNKSVERLDKNHILPAFHYTIHQSGAIEYKPDDALLKEQLDFIYKVSNDISKITAIINAA